MVEKMLLLWLSSKACGEASDFDGQLSEALVPSCLCPTFPVNDLAFFGFLLCARGVCFVAVAGLLRLKGASHRLI